VKDQGYRCDRARSQVSPGYAGYSTYAQGRKSLTQRNAHPEPLDCSRRANSF
jgi:hypothetical protein